MACRPAGGPGPASAASTVPFSVEASRSPDAGPPILAAHNRVRADVNVAALRWSDELAAVAQAWADTLARRNCSLEHSSGAYGENLFAASAGGSGPDAVASWAEEKQDYDHGRSRCRGVCGHYTQVVWARSTHVGCASATCGSAIVWVCNYDPPGNFIGEKPY